MLYQTKIFKQLLDIFLSNLLHKSTNELSRIFSMCYKIYNQSWLFKSLSSCCLWFKISTSMKPLAFKSLWRFIILQYESTWCSFFRKKFFRENRFPTSKCFVSLRFPKKSFLCNLLLFQILKWIYSLKTKGLFGLLAFKEKFFFPESQWIFKSEKAKKKCLGNCNPYVSTDLLYFRESSFFSLFHLEFHLDSTWTKNNRFFKMLQGFKMY